MAATAAYAPKAIPVEDRLAVAAVAILEALHDGHRDKVTLLRKANIALTREYRLYRSFRGQYQQPDKKHPGLHRNAIAYWVSYRTPYADRIIENLAVWQVMAALPDHHRKVLADFAFDGIRPKYATELQLARKAAWRLWHDWELPQPHLYKTRGRTLERRDNAIRQASEHVLASDLGGQNMLLQITHLCATVPCLPTGFPNIITACPIGPAPDGFASGRSNTIRLG